uniref:Uncharacterized protein n=1 Tax=Triticum urartu TaxID=4572 RepID=A0A8R7U6R2_TRIUA
MAAGLGSRRRLPRYACDVVVASLPLRPPPELVDDGGRVHLFFTVHHADEHRWTPHHGFLPTNGERDVPSLLCWYNTFLISVLVETRCRRDLPYQGAISERIGDWFLRWLVCLRNS